MKALEAKIKRTPQLKHKYLPASIKVLFPQNQYESWFRKFSTKSIKTYTSQYNKNMTHDLSDHTTYWLRMNSQFSPKAYSLFPPPPTKPLNKK